MDNTVIRLGEQDFEEAMDFLNLVFSMAGTPHDFARLLPKAYRPDEASMRCNLAIRRGGRIRAVVGVFPMTLKVGDVALKAAGIGGVATHPDERKSGLMTYLMKESQRLIQEDSCALSVLDGRRQRYGHFGYERTGCSVSVHLGKQNLRYLPIKIGTPSIEFVRLSPAEFPTVLATDTMDGLAERFHTWRLRMKSWHDAQVIHVRRSAEDFMAILASYHTRIWLALSAQTGEPAAYLTSDASGAQVKEIVGGSPELLLRVAAEWVARQEQDTVTFHMPPWNRDLIRLLNAYGETISLSAANCYRIYDWPLVLQALLAVQGKLTTLPEGQLTILLKSEYHPPTRIRLNWNAGKATVAKLRGYIGHTDLELDEKTAARLFFGPVRPSWIDGVNPIDARVQVILQNWLPLPLYWPIADRV